jgi:indole-3-glycerol phosphate synthase
MPAYLDKIIAAHRAQASGDRRDPDELLARATALPKPRAFTEALVAAGSPTRLAVISEIKRRSPSKGDLDLELDPASVAKEYESGGAACLSILTDREFFGGSPEDLQDAREACSIPVLRKDFTVSVADLCDARLMGADAVLLIVAALTDQELSTFLAVADQLTLAALVEVHDGEELRRAIDAGATLVGVNQRDLLTFEVDHQLAAALRSTFPSGVVSVAESGIRGREDAARLATAGYDAVLVGETLVRSGDRRAAVAELVEAHS